MFPNSNQLRASQSLGYNPFLWSLDMHKKVIYCICIHLKFKINYILPLCSLITMLQTPVLSYISMFWSLYLKILLIYFNLWVFFHVFIAFSDILPLFSNVFDTLFQCFLIDFVSFASILLCVFIFTCTALISTSHIF